MKICFAVSQYHLAELTAQPKIIKLLSAKVKGYYDSVYIVSEDSWLDIFSIKPDIIHSNGYKFTVLIWFINLFIRAKHIVILSETPEILNKMWLSLATFCLKRVDAVFVTSEYIKNKLNIPCEVVRIGLDV